MKKPLPQDIFSMPVASYRWWETMTFCTAATRPIVDERFLKEMKGDASPAESTPLGNGENSTTCKEDS
jgi:hypothetical protein